MSLSKAVIMGKTVRDPEKRFTNNNVPITFFAIDFSRNSELSILKVIAKGKLAETVYETVKKGSMVIIEGRLQNSVEKASDGTEKKSMEIDAAAIEVISAGVQDPSSGSAKESENNIDFGDISDDDLIGEDEIPF
jgi:single-stranded DNA-binding protein